MREVKFRAFDKRAKKMIFTGFHLMGEVMAFNGIEQYLFKTKRENETTLELWNNIETMQYTGLKDKNGVEIYEGDKYKTENNCYGEVIYEDGSFWCRSYPDKRFPNRQDMLIHAVQMGIEIIGNIWEDKE